MTYYVYRAYGDDGRLLYVGITCYVEERMKGHLRAGSPWLDQLAHLVFEERRGWDAAADAERKAIRSEWPLYNVQHSIEGPRTPPHLARFHGPVSPAVQLGRERRVDQALRTAGHAPQPPKAPEARFLREVDPNNELPEPERLRRAAEARQLYYHRLAIASAEGHRKAREARKAGAA